MKIVKINDNLKINIEQIYSLERTDNQNDIDIWNKNYKFYIEEYSKNPITLPISENKVFTPEFGKENDPEDLKLYTEALHNHILTIIGTPPAYVENFYVLLITGLKINIDKIIYDKINKYLEQFE
jgi:hypothetical protein